MRVVKEIFKVQPLQMDTVELVPGSGIEGSVGDVSDVIGNVLGGLVTIEKNALPMVDGNYELEVVTVGAVDVGTFKVTNIDNGFVQNGIASATANGTLVAGLNITVTTTEGTTVGDKVAFSVIGEQTYIIPGTVVGKLTNGKWRPVRSTDTASLFTQFRVAAGFQETDKTKTVLPIGYESNLSNVFTLDVVVYGQILESACNAINMKALSGLKEKMPFYAWL